MPTSPAILITMIKLSEKLLDNNVIEEDIVRQNLDRAAAYAASYKNNSDPWQMRFGPLRIDTADMFSALPNTINELSNRVRATTALYRNPTKDPSLERSPFNFSAMITNPELFTQDIARHKGQDPGPLATARPVSSPNIGLWDSSRTLNVPKPKQ